MPPLSAVPSIIVAGLAPTAFGVGLVGLVLAIALRVVFVLLVEKFATPNEVKGATRRTTMPDTSLDQFKPPVSH